MLAAGLGVVTAAPAMAEMPPPTPAPNERIAGDNRFATAAALSADAFPAGADVAYVASGVAFPDALAAGAAAASEGAPVLLAGSSSLPAPTATELRRLAPERIVLIGGSAAVADSVLDQLAGIAPTTRIGGANRYATAAMVATAAFDAADQVFVGVGTAFPDALGAAPAAAVVDAPILLAAPAGPSPAVRDALELLAPSKVVVLGGTAGLDDAAAERLRAAAGPDAQLERIGGADRYATSALLARRTMAPGAGPMFVATGASFADALAAGPAAAAQGAALVLVPGPRIPAPVAAAASALAPTRVVYVGGLSAVSASFAIDLDSTVDSSDPALEAVLSGAYLAVHTYELQERVRIVVSRDRDYLVARYTEASGDAEQAEEVMSSSGGVAMPGWLFVNLPLLEPTHPAMLHMVAIHEIYHLYQYSLAGPIPNMRPPNWLIEGTAMHIGWGLAALRYPGVPDQDRANTLMALERWTGSLADFEGDMIWSVDGAYGLSQIAVARLEALTSRDAVMTDYWVGRRNGGDWRETFQTTFGMTVEDFYADMAVVYDGLRQ